MDRETHRPAAPEQVDEGFDEGQEREPDTPEDERPPRFDRGQKEWPEKAAEATEKPRFDKGQAEREKTPEKRTERTFDEGLSDGGDR